MREEHSDHQLLFEISKGSQVAFRTLFERYKTRVLGACFYMLANRALAEDISQETWLTVVEKAGEYRATGSALSWILTISRNKCLNELRNRKKWKELDAEIEDNLVDPTSDIETILQSLKNEELLQEAILQLSETQRVSLLMFVQEEKSISEIARELNSSVSAVKVQLHRARESLKSKLGVP